MIAIWFSVIQFFQKYIHSNLQVDIFNISDSFTEVIISGVYLKYPYLTIYFILWNLWISDFKLYYN